MPKKTLTGADANRLAMELGYFHGLHKVLQDYEVSQELGARLKVMLFKHLLSKVQETKREIARLQASVERMEAACRAGMVPDPATGLQAFSPSVNRLFLELQTFDGWTISLLESDITLLSTIDNPQTAGVRVKSLKESFAQLWAVRQAKQGPLANHPDVFELTYVLPRP